MIRLGEFTDLQAHLAADPGLARFDSLQVEFRDGGDTGKVLSAFTVEGDSLAKIPIQYHEDGHALLVRIRGYLDSVGYCYSAWYRGDRMLGATDSCATMPRIVDIRMLSPADTLISINDSVVFRAEVSSRNGTLREFHWDFDGDGVPDSSGPLAGASDTLRVTRRFGNRPDSQGVRLSVSDADSNAASRLAVVRVELDAPHASAGPNRSVALGDSLVLKGSGSDGIGKIVSGGWSGLGDTSLAPGDQLIVTGKEIGVAYYVYRVIDDDGLSDADTLSVTTTLPDSNASLRAIYLFPGTLNPDFDPTRFDYELHVPAGTDSLKLTARPASLQAAVTLSEPVDSAKGDLFRTLAFSPAVTSLRIRVRSPAGKESEYRVKVTRDSAVGGAALGYARVPDPAAAEAVLGGGTAFNSAGKPVRFSRSAAGRYRLVFPGLGALGGEGHVQVTAYGSVPGYCSVGSWGGTDFAVDLACAKAGGASADLPFGVSVTWPRAHATGGNAFISNDVVPGDFPQKTKAGSAYNSSNGAATGKINVKRLGTGIAETTLYGTATDTANQGNALAVSHGRDSGWCRVVDLHSAGVDVTVTTACFGKTGAPADFLFSLSVVFPLLGSRDFDMAYAVIPEPSGEAGLMPAATRSYNSGGGAIASQRLGAGRWQVRFPGLETASSERAGIVQVSAYGGTESGFCQVEAWDPAAASATILCSDAQGLPEDSPFSIRVLR